MLGKELQMTKCLGISDDTSWLVLEAIFKDLEQETPWWSVCNFSCRFLHFTWHWKDNMECPGNNGKHVRSVIQSPFLSYD